MLKFVLIFIIPLISLGELENLVDEKKFLTEHLFANLKEDYQHVLNQTVDESLMTEINKTLTGFIQNVIETPKEIVENDGLIDKKSRKRRAITNLIRVDKAAGVYILNGFNVIGSIPVNFPKDICLISIEGKLFAAALTDQQTAESNKTILIFFVEKNGTFIKYKQFETKFADKMDCTANQNVGYVVLVNRIEVKTTSPFDGSPIFQVTTKDVVIVQRMSSIFLKSIRLWQHGPHLYLMKTIFGSNTEEDELCRVYRWKEFHFDIVAELRCQNAVQTEPFFIAETSEFFIAIANYMDKFGSTDTSSFIYKYDVNLDKFILFQKIQTKGAVDVKFFHFETGGNQSENFLVFANSIENYPNGTKNPETYSIIYKFVNGNFVPFQRLQFYAVRKFLPVIGIRNEFILLVACEKQEVQVYQYDGWRFILSSAFLTGDVFGKGISNMRTNIINGTTMVTIANRNVDKDFPNIFTPIFVQKNDLQKLQSGVLAWCQSSLERIKSVDFLGMMDKINRLPSTENDMSTKLRGNLELKNAIVNEFNTKSLTLGKDTLDKEFFETLKTAKQKVVTLKQMIESYETSNEIVGGEVDEEVNTQPSLINVDELIVENSFSSELLNGKPTLSLLHTTDNLDIDTLRVNGVNIVNGLKVRNTIDGLKFDKNHVLLRNGDQHLNGTLSFLNLNVGEIKTPQINQISLSSNSQTDNNVSILPKSIIVDRLIVKGLTNRVSLADIDQVALKVIGDQTLVENFVIESLTAHSVQVFGLISGRNMSNTITATVGDTHFINQDIQFADRVHVNNLNVRERINNLNVARGGRLNVLLKNSPELQTVTGNKVFEKIKLLEPIVLHGKIQASKNLDQINPIVTVNDDVRIVGDYVITGNITIQRVMKALNIFGESRTHNVGKLLETGLPLNATTISNSFTFVQPIKVANLQVHRINECDARNFVKLGVDNLQEISGLKTFTGDLKIDGFCESNSINGVNMDKLNETILRRTGDQIVKGRIQVKAISANNVLGKTTKINNHDITDYIYLSENSPQLPTNVTILGHITVRKSLNVKNLITTNQVCGYKLHEMIDDTLLAGQEVRVTGAKKFLNTLTVDNLLLNGTLFGNDWNLIKTGMATTAGHNNRILFNNTTIFKHKLKTKRLVFKGDLNGIARDDFGYLWLLYEKDQEFTAPQTIEKLTLSDNLWLTGALNNLNLTNYFVNCLWINRPEYIAHGIFREKIISRGAVVVNGLIGGIRLENALLTASRNLQVLSEEFIIGGLLNVSKHIFIESSLNGLKMKNLKSFQQPTTDGDLSEGLVIQGDCKFNMEPEISTLNYQNLKDLYQNAWMLNENLVIMENVFFEEAQFMNTIKFNGFLNNVDLNDLAQNYFSLTKPQTVTTILRIKGDIIANSYFVTQSIMMDGRIYDSTGQFSVNIVDFDKNVLKINQEQTITGQWKISNVFIAGDLDGVIVNGLNLAHDILRYDVTDVKITAPKSFQNVIVQNLNCATCFIQECDLIEWMNNAVIRDGVNHIGSGNVNVVTAKIENVFTNNSINGVVFRSDALLTKSTDQIIDTNLIILSTFDRNQRVEISKLDVNKVNDIQVDFLGNVMTHGNLNNRIESRIKFIQPVVIGDLMCGGSVFGVNMTAMFGPDEQIEEKFRKLSQDLDYYYSISERIHFGYHEYAFYLDHFVLRQTIPGQILKTASLKLSHPANQLTPNDWNCLAMLSYNKEQKTTAVNFFNYDHRYGNYQYSSEMRTIISQSPVEKINNIERIDKDLIYIETHDLQTHNYKHTCLKFEPISRQFSPFNEFVTNITRKILSMKMMKHECLITHSELAPNVEVYCLNGNSNSLVPNQEIKISPVRQAISLIDEFHSSLLLLTTTGPLEIWLETVAGNLVHKQSIELFHPSWMAATTFQHYNYVAVCSEPMNNSVHHGAVEIYRSGENGDYYQYQKISIKLPKQVEFSVLASDELVLYILTENPLQPFIVYVYTGVEGFKEFATGFSLPKGHHFSVMSYTNMKKEFIVYSANENVLIIEGIFK